MAWRVFPRRVSPELLELCQTIGPSRQVGGYVNSESSPPLNVHVKLQSPVWWDDWAKAAIEEASVSLHAGLVEDEHIILLEARPTALRGSP